MTHRLHTDLVNVMARHIGREQGISSRSLAKVLGIDTRSLRSLISAAREDGLAVCGTPAFGYYMPANDAELDEACEFLKRRALHSLRLMSVMKKVAMPTLVGQLLLSQG